MQGGLQYIPYIIFCLSKSPMMDSRILQLDMLLDYFLQQSSDPQMSTRSARQLTLFSEREGFIDSALELLSTFDLSWNKLTLLSCMVKDYFKYCFEVVNGDKMDEYYQTLCQIASNMGIQHKALFNNIAQTLAIIYINAAAVSMADYSIATFLRHFELKDNVDLYHYYFKILEYCASEIDSSSLVLEENYRNKAKKRMANQQILVVMALNEKAQEIWSDCRYDKEPIITCLEWWIDIKHNQEMLSVLPDLFIFKGVVETLRDENRVDCAIACLKAVVFTMNSEREDQKIYNLMLQLLCQVLLLADQNLALRYFDTAELLIELVTDFGKKFAPTLVERYSTKLHEQFFMPLLKFFSTGIEKIVENLIDFSKQVTTAALEGKKRGFLAPQLKMVSLTILLHLLEVIQYPSHLLLKLNEVLEHRLSSHFSLGEVIYRYRQESVVVFEVIAQLLGVRVYLDKVVEIISQLNPEEQCFWGKLQACLYCLVSPLKGLDQMSENCVFLINTYEEVVVGREVPTLIQRTFLRLFRPLFSVPGRDAEVVMKLFNYTSSCFQYPLLFESTERTYYKGCEDNPILMNPYIADMFTIVETYPNQEYIVRGFICVACADTATAYMYVEQCLNFLLLRSTDQLISLTKKKEYLTSLSAAIKELMDFEFEEKIQVVKSFTRNAWFFILDTLREPRSKTDDEDTLIERIVRLIKNIMRLLKTDFSEFMPDLFSTVNQAFQKYPICSYVYLVEIAVTVFHNHPDGPGFLAKLYENFSSLAFNHLKTPQSIDRYGYLVDDFLGMSGRLIFFNTSIIIQSHQFPSLLNFVSGDCLLTNSPKVNKATYKFLEELFMIFWSSQLKQDYNQSDNDYAAPVFNTNLQIYHQIRVFLLQQMENIVSHMLQHLSQLPNEAIKDRIIDALLSEIKAFPNENMEIWKEPLLKIPSDVLLVEEKEKILEKFLRCREKSRQGFDLKECMDSLYKDLQLIYRRMEASERRKRFRMSFK